MFSGGGVVGFAVKEVDIIVVFGRSFALRALLRLCCGGWRLVMLCGGGLRAGDCLCCGRVVGWGCRLLYVAVIVVVVVVVLFVALVWLVCLVRVGCAWLFGRSVLAVDVDVEGVVFC